MHERPMSLERRYLLGAASEDENAAVEAGYFKDADALNSIADAEDALIDAYLAGELDENERARFERHYLASPVHRRRVETVRRLRQAHAPRSGASSMRRWLAVAAVLCVAVGSAWLLTGRSSPAARPDTIAPTAARSTPAPVAPAPRVFAFSLPLVNVRGASDPRRLVVPSGIDVVRLDLEGTRPTALDQDVVLQTVAGIEVWRGRAATVPLPPGVTARVEVPAALLRPDDYFVLAGSARYFLSVRTGR
jgi:putative zinc finger protein